jgi:hypothetical protein
MTDEARRAELAALIEKAGWTNTPFSRCSYCGEDWNDVVGHEHGQGEMDPEPPYGFILVHEDKGGTIKFDAEKAADAVLAYVAGAVAQAVQEYRTKARGSMAAGVECDLCEEVVTEWEWVDKGWSLACRPCLDKIRAQAVKEKDAFGTELSNKKAQITELLRHQNVLHKEIARLRPAVESAMLWFKEHGKPELSWQYEAALRRAPAGNAGTGTTSRDIPRRIRIDRMVPAERAIRDAKLAVEALGADVRLTDAVVLLGQAQDNVADFVDAQAGDAGKGDGKMLCSFCGKAVDPEGHRWECPRREPAP